jgi:HD-GYP domain-containing protein (c-di-GMP phosphodiesterase class II)
VILDLFQALSDDLAQRGLEGGITVARAHERVLGFYRSSLAVFLIDGRDEARAHELLGRLRERVEDDTVRAILFGAPAGTSPLPLRDRGVVALLRVDATAEEAQLAVDAAFEVLRAHHHADIAHDRADRAVHERDSLLATSWAISREHDLATLLALILTNARHLTGADAGSIYVTETQGHEHFLRFKLTQNDSVRFQAGEFLIPFGRGSIAGTAAAEKRMIVVDDVRTIPAGSGYHYDSSFDERIGYRTISMLVVPLISRRNEVIGVVQLINRKREEALRLTPENVQRSVLPFGARSEELVQMLAQQAGFTLENALLYEEIHQLFAGFVRASVEAIESRDPTTSGHSLRVARYTIGLAQAVDREVTGPFASAHFDRRSLRELEYASLMHDFGKIGVREKVLVKAKKLYDEQLALVRLRFENAKLQSRVAAFEEALRDPTLTSALSDRFRTVDERLDHWLGVVLRANEPSVLPANAASELGSIAAYRWLDDRGDARSLLTQEELLALEVPRGSLTIAEVDEIRSHVTHSIRFLSRIPWSRDLERVPTLAGAHHERMDGKGYPYGLVGEAIPLPSRIMAVADVYDALTAADRPYKRALGREEAIAILDRNAREGHLDARLVQRFVDDRCFELDLEGSGLLSSSYGASSNGI